MKYDFDIAIKFIENEDSKTKTQLSKEAGITGVTLYNWIERADNDLYAKQKHYGKAYFNMYRDGISKEYVTRSLEINGSKFITIFGFVFGDSLFLVPNKYVNYVKTADWYKALENYDYKK